MKRILAAVFGLLVNPNLFAHEEFIQEVISHGNYLEEMHVNTFGDLRLIGENKLTQTLSFSEIRGKDLYGIGMREGLDSELLITSGQLFEGLFDQHQYAARRIKGDLKIAFLAYANIKNWTTIAVPSGVTTFDELEKELPLLAAEAGIDPDVPFPFLLRAHTTGLNWFIADGVGNGKPNFRASFLRSRYLGGLSDVKIEGVGIYSSHHRGIVSAPNSSMHIHFLTKNEPIFLGHLDNEMMITSGAEILFPVN